MFEYSQNADLAGLKIAKGFRSETISQAKAILYEAKNRNGKNSHHKLRHFDHFYYRVFSVFVASSPAKPKTKERKHKYAHEDRGRERPAFNSHRKGSEHYESSQSRAKKIVVNVPRN
jgi:hypothetical protein